MRPTFTTARIRYIPAAQRELAWIRLNSLHPSSPVCKPVTSPRCGHTHLNLTVANADSQKITLDPKTWAVTGVRHSTCRSTHRHPAAAASGPGGPPLGGWVGGRRVSPGVWQAHATAPPRGSCPAASGPGGPPVQSAQAWLRSCSCCRCPGAGRTVELYPWLSTRRSR